MNPLMDDWEPPQGWDGWIDETLSSYNAADSTDEAFFSNGGSQYYYSSSPNYSTVVSSDGSYNSSSSYAPSRSPPTYATSPPSHFNTGQSNSQRHPLIVHNPQWHREQRIWYDDQVAPIACADRTSRPSDGYSGDQRAPLTNESGIALLDTPMPTFKPVPERIEPPIEVLNCSPMPKEQPPRFHGDLYTAAWVRGEKSKREGWCGFCKKWLELKNSTYWYHMHYVHGISCLTGRPMKEPLGLRQSQSGWEANCGSCDKWISIGSGERGRTAYFRHAYKCQGKPRPSLKLFCGSSG